MNTYLPLYLTIYDSDQVYASKLERLDREFITNFAKAALHTMQDMENIGAAITHFDTILFFVKEADYILPKLLRNSTAVISNFTTQFNLVNHTRMHPYTFSTKNQLFPDLVDPSKMSPKAKELVEYANHWIELYWKRISTNKSREALFPGFEDTLVANAQELITPTVFLRTPLYQDISEQLQKDIPNATITLVK